MVLNDLSIQWFSFITFQKEGKQKSSPGAPCSLKGVGGSSMATCAFNEAKDHLVGNLLWQVWKGLMTRDKALSSTSGYHYTEKRAPTISPGISGTHLYRTQVRKYLQARAIQHNLFRTLSPTVLTGQLSCLTNNDG